VVISDFIEEKGLEAFEKKDFNLKGMMAKRKTSKYTQGTRSADWLKIKNIKTQDCVVTGFTKGEGNRQGYFGSLLLAMYDETGGLDPRYSLLPPGRYEGYEDSTGTRKRSYRKRRIVKHIAIGWTRGNSFGYGITN
jgi:ATP-dependent DNA ligase